MLGTFFLQAGESEGVKSSDFLLGHAGLRPLKREQQEAVWSAFRELRRGICRRCGSGGCQASSEG